MHSGWVQWWREGHEAVGGVPQTGRKSNHMWDQIRMGILEALEPRYLLSASLEAPGTGDGVPPQPAGELMPAQIVSGPASVRAHM